jgi:GNAT superfamily N-acetyltransferase
MSVRLAEREDLSELVKLGERFHAQMVYNAHPFQPDVFEETLAGYMDRDDFAVWIGKDAMAAAMVGRHLATGHVMASEIFLYSEGASQGMRLLREMANWAKEKGAGELILTDQMNMRDLAALYSRVGAKPVERVYRVEF